VNDIRTLERTAHRRIEEAHAERAAELVEHLARVAVIDLDGVVGEIRAHRHLVAPGRPGRPGFLPLSSVE
jgi:hypothetical protein